MMEIATAVATMSSKFEAVATTIKSEFEEVKKEVAKRSPLMSPLVRTTGTNSRSDEVILSRNRLVPANFAYVHGDVATTYFPEYELSERQQERVTQHKYFNAIKNGIKERYGGNRYAVQKSIHRMFIRDGMSAIFSCVFMTHDVRCVYLEMLSVDFDVDRFMQVVGSPVKTAEQYQTMPSPDHL